MSEQKIWPNSGRAFKNDNKQTDKHPDFKGDGEVTCPHCARRVLFFADMWKRLSAKNGSTWLSFTFKPKDKQPAAEGDAPASGAVRPFSESMDFNHTGGAAKRPREIGDDEIPF